MGKDAAFIRKQSEIRLVDLNYTGIPLENKRKNDDHL